MKKPFSRLYGRWMYRWETALTTRDTNRIVRPVEWGFEWLQDFTSAHGFTFAQPAAEDHAANERAMLALNDFILQRRAEFFAYDTPQDFHLEDRHPQLFPTNVRPETLQRDAKLRARAADGHTPTAQFLRFTSPVRTPYPENDRVNAR